MKHDKINSRNFKKKKWKKLAKSDDKSSFTIAELEKKTKYGDFIEL